MSHPLLDSIERVKRVARNLTVCRAISIVVVCSLMTGIVLAFFDYQLRFEDVGTRLFFTLVWLAVVVGSVWYFLVPVWKADWSNQSIARMIERRFPSLANRLSSSVEFLQSGGTSLGSKTLMRNVINQTTTVAEGVRLGDAVDRRPTIKWLVAVAAVVALASVILAANPSDSKKALGRLLLPFQSNPWPRVNNLAFVEAPTKVARGGELRLAVVDEVSRLPQHVDLHVWYDGEAKSDIDVIPMQRVTVTGKGDGTSVTQMTYERTNVSRSFRYRAVGGDHESMDWQKLDVVDPPQVVSGSIILQPPEYTGWLPSTIQQASGSLRVLQGTELTFRGSADRALERVELCTGDDSAAASTQDSQRFLGKLSGDGLQYEVPNDEPTQHWIVVDNMEYTLSMTDRDGTSTVDADRWSVRVVRDERPTLKLLEPDNEELITPEANVSIDCEVEDDLAIESVELRYLRTDKSDVGEKSIKMFEGPASLSNIETPRQLPPAVDSKRVEHRWSLEPMRLAPGAVLSFHLRAADYKGQENQTLPRRLVVVSENDLIDRVGRRQSLVLSRLQQRLKQQRQANESVDAVVASIQETQQAAKATMDRLQSSLQVQRQVNSALVGDDAEVTKELRRLRGLLDRSQIGEVDVRTRVEKTLSALQEMGQTDLEPAMRLATNSRQALQATLDLQDDNALSKDVKDEVVAKLGDTSNRQKAAIGKLERLLDDLSAWDNYRRFAQELRDILRQQRDVARQTQEAAKETLSRASAEVDGNARAALRGAAARQLELARRTDRTLQNLAKAERELQEKDPQSSQMVGEAIDRARNGAVSGTMREAGRQIDQNQLGAASQRQQAAESTLQDMLDELSRRSYSPEERIEKMEEVGRELERLQKRQSQLTQDFAKANKQQDEAKKKRDLQRLRKRQQQVAEELRKLQRQMQRLRSQQSSQQAGQAASSAGNAASAAEKGDAQEAWQQSELAEAQMEQAQQSLQQQKEEAKSELAQEQMVRLPQLVEALVAQQASVVGEIQRLDRLRLEIGDFSEAQEASVLVTAEAQRTVAQDTALVAKQMAQLPVFVFALDEAQQTMLDVAGQLDRLNTDADTQRHAEQVLGSLKMIREMLQHEQQSRQQPSGGSEGQQNDGGQQGQQGDNIDPRLAQLKLLRGMQIAINNETKRLNTVTAGDAGAIIERQQQSLANRQGKLGDIVSEMFKPAPTNLDAPREEEAASDADSGLDALDRELELLLQ